MRVVKEEEVSFFRTLSTGMQRLTALMTDNSSKIISGEVAFELYDTFGFPIDLTDLVARENGFSVDMVVFQRCLEEQKNRSKADASKQMGDWQVVNPESEESFCGYDVTEIQTTISRHRTVTVKGDKQQFQLVLDNTPFYAESGGQVGDTGVLKGVENGEVLRVINTVKDNKLHIHLVDKLPENPIQNFVASVDKSKRNLISSNHSATHLMHSALRETLGSHVAQKGSLVNSEYLRFDFSHFGKMAEDEIAQVEARVNAQIRASIPLQEHRNIPIDEATAMGATALFGEKYGDFVRVIEFDRSYSMELCGGTHVNNTAEIGLFKITSESSVAAGVRRIEAVTNQGAQSLINGRLQLLESVEQALNNAKDLVQAIEKLLQENADLKSKLEAIELSQIASIKQSLKTSFRELNGMQLLIVSIELPSADAAKQLCFQLKNEIANSIIGLVFTADGKPGIALYIDENLVTTKGYNASLMVREAAKHIQGGGGGQPFFASAGGKDVSGIENAADTLKSYFN
jgi:alanyl-tRNA synthetase